MDSVGSAARDEYLLANNLAHKTPPAERITKGILKVRHFTADATKDAKLSVSKAAVTLTKEVLDKNATASEIRQFMVDLEAFNVTVPATTGITEKKNLIEALLPLRRQLFQVNNNAKKELEATAINRFYGSTTEETRTEEFSRLRYSTDTLDTIIGHESISNFRIEL